MDIVEKFETWAKENGYEVFCLENGLSLYKIISNVKKKDIEIDIDWDIDKGYDSVICLNARINSKDELDILYSLLDKVKKDEKSLRKYLGDD